MKNLFKGIVVAAMLLSCFALVSAQGGNGGGGGGRRGGGGFGQGRGRGGGGEMALVQRADVQKDLVITDDEKTKIADLVAKQREARRAAGGGGAGGGGGAAGGGGGGGRGQQMDPAAREAMMKRMQEQQAQEHKDLAGVLTDAQMKRLAEIRLQTEGNRALLREEVQKSLNFSSDQASKVKDLQTKQQEASASLRQKMQNQELTREEMQATTTKNNKTMDDELVKVLTPDQASKFKTMQGAPFKADPPAARGGGGGGL